MLVLVLIILAVLAGCRTVPTTTVPMTTSAAITLSTSRPVMTSQSGQATVGMVSRIKDLGQAQLNRRVTIEGRITEIERHARGNALVRVQDTTGTMPAFLKAEDGFDLLALAVGSRFRMIGQLQSYQGSYEIVPAQNADIVLLDGYEFEAVKVLRITDGDTITVAGTDGQSRKIRIVGVDSPEMPLNGQPAEFFANEAKAFTEKSLLNKTVYLERDNSDTDPYERQLRYVWLTMPVKITAETVAKSNFSSWLIAGGYAAAYRSGDDDKYRSLFLSLEDSAKSSRKGMWQ